MIYKFLLAALNLFFNYKLLFCIVFYNIRLKFRLRYNIFLVKDLVNEEIVFL